MSYVTNNKGGTYKKCITVGGDNYFRRERPWC